MTGLVLEKASHNTAYLVSLRYTQMLRTSDDADTLSEIFFRIQFLFYKFFIFFNQQILWNKKTTK